MKNYPEALKYLNKNLEICKVAESANALSTAYLALGDVYMMQKNMLRLKIFERSP
ncbi:MAG: hypothetical protein IPP61_00015 [Cytophagaceae bacterium]|nr:hypothetical protein [Cytophagaceae bacterium]